MLLLCLALALAFWQDQQATPRRLHDAAVRVHSQALFARMQDELQLTDRLLQALDLSEMLQDAGDANAFARIAKTLTPGIPRPSSPVAHSQVTGTVDEQLLFRLLPVGDMIYKRLDKRLDKRFD